MIGFYLVDQKTLVNYNECIEFHLVYKEIEITNIDTIDMNLLEAIYNKAKELFVWIMNY